MEPIIGGIEGGGTHSTLVLMDTGGKLLAKVKGPGTNHWIIGMTECRKRISDMVTKAKLEIGMDNDRPLTALGLSLSGCEQEETNEELKNGLLTDYPNISLRYLVCSDTVGSVATFSSDGGMVLISGTGSNALLINPNGNRVQCGGWGYLMGDEGSAFWIAHRAVKIVFDDQDNFEEPPYPTDFVWDEIKKHFQVETRTDLLEHLYSRFDKPKFASLCLRIAAGARSGDKLCRLLFREAGELIARAVLALIPSADLKLFNQPGGLHILCVGSVWLSWSLLAEGFISRLKKHPETLELSLMRLNTTMAVGAAYLAADNIKLSLPRNYNENYDVFYHFESTAD